MPPTSSQYYNSVGLKKDKILYREYQYNIIQSCRDKNSLVVLPTGLGKTIIGILMISEAIKKYPKSKVIILAPTRPLVSQHHKSCVEFLDIAEEDVVLFTGKIPSRKRIEIFQDAKIVISTPQIIKNDVLRGRYSLSTVSLIIFDEAHHTVGNYPNTFIAQNYMKQCSDPLILGLTASPGKNHYKIQRLCDNLFVEQVIFKTYKDHDVKQYIYDINLIAEVVSLNADIMEISQIWDDLFHKFLLFFIERKLIKPYKKYVSKLHFLNIAQDLTISLRFEEELEDNEEILSLLYFSEPKVIDVVRELNLNIHSIYSYCSSCISILHAKELLETQNFSLFNSYLENIEFKARSEIIASQRIVNSKHYKLIKSLLQKKKVKSLTHPKIPRLLSILKEELGNGDLDKIIVFTQYREMAETLKHIIKSEFKSKYVVEKFIGQTSKINDIGYKQSKQLEILQDFKKGKINILIATSVAEEGLDIPNVDVVIFYEPVPSEIRLIQRRGRTGRYTSGRCYVLVTSNTVDVAFHKSALRKESNMNLILKMSGCLELVDSIDRSCIDFTKSIENAKRLDLTKTYDEIRKREKEHLLNRSLEEILEELDRFSKSQEYDALRNHGVTFLSDLVDYSEKKIKKKIRTIRKFKEPKKKATKRYFNRNLKTLVNLAKTYSTNGKIRYSEFKILASEEDIQETKFNTHFYQACNLGLLKKEKDHVYYLNDFE